MVTCMGWLFTFLRAAKSSAGSAPSGDERISPQVFARIERAVNIAARTDLDNDVIRALRSVALQRMQQAIDSVPEAERERVGQAMLIALSHAEQAGRLSGARLMELAMIEYSKDA
jgi:DNA-directed RNA polymerase specialized sigma24 family protein